MSDHEQTPPDDLGGLLKPAPITPDVSPLATQASPAGPIPTGFMPAPATNFQGTAAPALAKAPVPMAPAVHAPVQEFKFQFMAGKPYDATITVHPTQGASIFLQKFENGAWSPSVSRLKHGILGAFVLHQAIEQEKAKVHAAHGPKASMSGGSKKLSKTELKAKADLALHDLT